MPQAIWTLRHVMTIIKGQAGMTLTSEPRSARDLLRELEPVVATELDRHLSVAKKWFPHVSVDGHVVRTVAPGRGPRTCGTWPCAAPPSRAASGQTRAGAPQRHTRPAQRRGGWAVEIERTATKDGKVSTAGATHLVGFRLGRPQDHLVADGHLMHAVTDNALIGSWPCPITTDRLTGIPGATVVPSVSVVLQLILSASCLSISVGRRERSFHDMLDEEYQRAQPSVDVSADPPTSDRVLITNECLFRVGVGATAATLTGSSVKVPALRLAAMCLVTLVRHGRVEWSGTGHTGRAGDRR